MTSGVPQGSVLGPILFLIFINDLERGIVSPVYKFTDDIKLLGKVSSAEGRDLLQQDLQHLTDWSAKWQMPFNTAKCKVMHLGRGNEEFQYFMNGHQLATVTEERDLGVQLTSDMKPSRQCQLAYSTASKVLFLIRHSSFHIIQENFYFQRLLTRCRGLDNESVNFICSKVYV